MNRLATHTLSLDPEIVRDDIMITGGAATTALMQRDRIHTSPLRKR
ncbi:hypothetical protein PARMER_03119, partial [Parabacteroides merdae ATCC 43184]